MNRRSPCICIKQKCKLSYVLGFIFPASSLCPFLLLTELRSWELLLPQHGPRVTRPGQPWSSISPTTVCAQGQLCGPGWGGQTCSGTSHTGAARGSPPASGSRLPGVDPGTDSPSVWETVTPTFSRACTQKRGVHSSQAATISMSLSSFLGPCV